LKRLGVHKRKKGGVGVREERPRTPKEAGDGKVANFPSIPEGTAGKSAATGKTVMLISEYENDVTPVLEKLGVTMGNVQKFHNASTTLLNIERVKLMKPDYLVIQLPSKPRAGHFTGKETSALRKLCFIAQWQLAHNGHVILYGNQDHSIWNMPEYYKYVAKHPRANFTKLRWCTMGIRSLADGLPSDQVTSVLSTTKLWDGPVENSAKCSCESRGLQHADYQAFRHTHDGLSAAGVMSHHWRSVNQFILCLAFSCRPLKAEISKASEASRGVGTRPESSQRTSESLQTPKAGSHIPPAPEVLRRLRPELFRNVEFKAEDPRLVLKKPEMNHKRRHC